MRLDIVDEWAPWLFGKLPLNETEFGLIDLLFPESPLLHVSPRPLDAVFSAFSRLLTNGNYCAFALESAAPHFARMMGLIDWYRREIELPYFAARYEYLVIAGMRRLALY